MTKNPSEKRTPKIGVTKSHFAALTPGAKIGLPTETPEPISHNLGAAPQPDPVNSNSWGKPTLSKFSLLWLDGLRVSVRIQMENVVRNLLIQLHVGVMGHPVIA